MIVIDEVTITKYEIRNAQAREAVRGWFAKVQLCTWNSPHDVLADFSSTDFIGKGRYIFDIKGNHGRLLELRDAFHAFGESHGHTPGLTCTITGVLEVEMFRLRLRQKEMAEELGIGASRLSEVLRGKRPAGIDLRRALYTKLHIPAEKVLLLD